jgi:hypothetical protein
MGHHKWVKMVPSTWREGRWATWSMLWINKDIEAEQVPVDSPDMTAAIIQLPERMVLVVSVYVPVVDVQALRNTCETLSTGATSISMTCPMPRPGQSLQERRLPSRPGNRRFGTAFGSLAGGHSKNSSRRRRWSSSQEKARCLGTRAPSSRSVKIIIRSTRNPKVHS